VKLGRIFAPKKDELTENWRKVHNNELYNVLSFPHIVRMIRSKGLNGQGM
jgi:hypothetical protein